MTVGKGSVAVGTILLLLLSTPWFAMGHKASRPPETFSLPGISADSAIILDPRDGEVLYAKNPHKRLPMASTAKVMTGLLTLENLKGEEPVQISEQAALAPPSKMHLKAGEVYLVRELLQGLLMSSANDASVALAQKVAGSEPLFVERMNARARELGALDTHFINASGLPGEGQYASVHDLAVIFQNAMRNDEFAAIMRRQTAVARSEEGRIIPLRNHNRLLWSNWGSLGGKTGFTGEARHTYVGEVEQQGHPLVFSVLKSQSLWDDLQRLLHFGYQQLSRFGYRGVAQMVQHLGPVSPTTARLKARRAVAKRATVAKAAKKWPRRQWHTKRVQKAPPSVRRKGGSRRGERFQARQAVVDGEGDGDHGGLGYPF